MAFRRAPRTWENPKANTAYAGVTSVTEAFNALVVAGTELRGMARKRHLAESTQGFHGWTSNASLVINTHKVIQVIASTVGPVKLAFQQD
jgi:hypothetical protein